MVTIFAVQDSVLDPANLPGPADLNRLIYDGLSYTPDMSDGLCLTTRGGGSLRITRQGSNILVNGVRISRPNVISKNGVIQYLEQVCYTFSTLGLLCTKWHSDSAGRAMHVVLRLQRGGAECQKVCWVCLGCLQDGRLWFIGF